MDEEMNLLLRSFDGELAEEERTQLDDLLDRSAKMRAERARIMHLRAMVAASRTKAFGPDFADRVLRHIPSAQETTSSVPEPTSFAPEATSSVPEAMSFPRKTGSREGVAGWMNRVVLALPLRRLAAGLAVLLAIAVGVTLWMQPRTVEVPYGELRTLELSDGSTVELSGGSTVTYRHFFGQADRRVELTGEAFFEVTTGDRTFLVETFNANVHVLGTRFNVRAWPDEAQTDVALEEGRVSVESRAATARTLATQEFAAPIVLEPGEATTVAADSAATRRTVSLDRVLAWRTGGLFIVDKPLGSAFRTIERRFGVRVTAQDPALLESTVTYLNPSPESAADVLTTICHTLNLQYRRTAGGFEVLAP